MKDTSIRGSTKNISPQDDQGVMPVYRPMQKPLVLVAFRGNGVPTKMLEHTGSMVHLVRVDLWEQTMDLGGQVYLHNP